MKLLSIEPTPSPNSMKLNLDETLPSNERYTYTKDNLDTAPDLVRQLMTIPGVTGLFHVADFMAIDRHPRGEWQAILGEARRILGGVPDVTDQGQPLLSPQEQAVEAGAWGEVRVAVQYFRGIPMQIRAYAETAEERLGLGELFTAAAMQAGLASPNLIKERKLEEHGVRYGELAEVLAEVARELGAAYPEDRLRELVRDAELLGPGEAPVKKIVTAEAALAVWEDPDWRVRYSALEKIKPTAEALPLLTKALSDPQVSIRRLAAVYTADIRTPKALELLFVALKDPSPIVRRTVGDTLSDIGDPAATGPMAEALMDRNKLVRWRAARFLYEVGTDDALAALHAAADDPEFEVRMQIQIAILRIEGGEEAAGSVWQQMTARSRE